MDSPARVEEAAIGWVPLEGTPAAARWRAREAPWARLRSPTAASIMSQAPPLPGFEATGSGRRKRAVLPPLLSANPVAR